MNVSRGFSISCITIDVGMPLSICSRLFLVAANWSLSSLMRGETLSR